MTGDLLDRLNIHNAIKCGDVGCIEDMLPRLAARFAGGKNSISERDNRTIARATYRMAR